MKILQINRLAPSLPPISPIDDGQATEELIFITDAKSRGLKSGIL